MQGVMASRTSAHAVDYPRLGKKRGYGSQPLQCGSGSGATGARGARRLGPELGRSGRRRRRGRPAGARAPAGAAVGVEAAEHRRSGGGGEAAGGGATGGRRGEPREARARPRGGARARGGGVWARRAGGAEHGAGHVARGGWLRRRTCPADGGRVRRRGGKISRVGLRSFFGGDAYK